MRGIVGMNKYTVYKHISPVGKVYIGITKRGVADRWGKNGIGYKDNVHFYNAIQKYGWDNFTHEILYTDLSKEDACAKEIELIKVFKSNDFRYGYNICAGGEGRLEDTQSDSTKQKISEAVKAQWQDDIIRQKRIDGLHGHKVTQETRDKIRQAQLGKFVPKEVGDKISKSKKGKHPWNYGKKCSPRTEETKRKISESSRGKTISKEQREQISNKLKGREITPEWREKISNTLKQRNAERRKLNNDV